MVRIGGSNNEPSVFVIREIAVGERPEQTSVQLLPQERPLNLQHYVIRYQGRDIQVPPPGIVFSKEDRRKYFVPDDAAIRIGAVRFFTHLHRILDLLAEYPVGAAVQYERKGRVIPVFSTEFPFVSLAGGKSVLKIDGEPIELDIVEPITSRGGYRLEAFAGSELHFRPDPEVEEALFRVGRRFLAHGTGRNGFMTLFSIAVEGKIVPSSWRGVFHGGLVNSRTAFSPSMEAGPHGPFYVVLNKAVAPSREPIMRDNHKAYLVPDMESKRLFLSGVRELHGLGVIERDTAIEIINKLYTYEEFIEEANTGRRKEGLKNYAGLPPIDVLFDIWRNIFVSMRGLFRRIVKRGRGFSPANPVFGNPFPVFVNSMPPPLLMTGAAVYSFRPVMMPVRPVML